jgi:hypothetical protein
MVLRARYDGKVFVPEDPVSLPANRVVDLDVREVSSPPRGSAQAILQAMSEPPHLEPADGEALMAAIQSARLPVQEANVFDEEKPSAK